MSPISPARPRRAWWSTSSLDATAASLDDLLARAIERRLAPRELLEEIVRSEAAHRSRRSLERRRVKSRLGAFKPIADQAVLAGYSVLFRTATELLDDVQCDSPERRRQRIAAYTRAHLLCIDEIGYLSYDDHAADLLYKVINPRYEKRRSLLVSTNLAFKDWNTIFPNATCIVTLIEGDSYRRRESETEAAARRKTRSA